MSLLIPLAYAHVGATITGVDVEANARGLMVEANFGLVVPDEQGDWRWTCHETVTAEGVILTPRYARGPDGTLLVTITAMQGIEADHSLYRSADGGCSWSSAGLPGVLVSTLDWSSELPLLGTGALDEGADNDLYRSLDGGLTWVPAGLELGERLTLSILGDGDLAWATVADPDTDQGWLYSSADRGETWTSMELELPLDGQALQRLIVVAGEPEQVWLLVSTLGQDHVLRVTPSSQDVVHTAEGDLIDGARTSDGELWVVEGSRAVYRSSDGLSFELSEVAPKSIGVGADQDPLLTGYADYTGGLLFRHDELVLSPYEIVGPLACPEDAASTRTCDPLWEELDSRLQIFAPVDTDDPGSPTEEEPPVREPEPRSACGVPLAPSALLGLFALLLTRRRR
jgi:hypothetical protein